MTIRFPRYTPARRQKALEKAENDFSRAHLKRGKRKYVSLRTSAIKERLELFQPREFSSGARSVDGNWVKELVRRIGIHGELEPILVIRLGNAWVCVDGHHRIAAYRARGYKKPIRCEWFTGTPTEAVDECMRRNNKDHLPIPLADRSEEAWRRVLLDQGSKSEISKACGISTSTIATMRKVKRKYESDPEFAARVNRPLMETSWGVMLLAQGDITEETADLDERAERLARTIRSRLSDMLKRDAVVTAFALAKYDKGLPRTLVAIWNGHMSVPAPRNLTEPEMKRQMQLLRERADSIEKMLAKLDLERPKQSAEAEKERERELIRRQRLWHGIPDFDAHEDVGPIEL
jgi:hypothetical protein